MCMALENGLVSRLEKLDRSVADFKVTSPQSLGIV
jgi:hypothetical protein